MVIFIGNRPHESINIIVQKTQVHISNLKKNFKDEGRLLQIDPKYLSHLNLTQDFKAHYPKSPWLMSKNDASSEPVILSAVTNGKAGEAVHFVRNTQMFLPNKTIILYDLGMSRHENQLLLQYCNSSSEPLSTNFGECAYINFKNVS